MKGSGLFSLALGGILMGLGAPAVAHHSFAMFDQTRPLTIKGTVVKLQWQNPHTYLAMKVKDAAGDTKGYLLEGSSPNELLRWGWKLDSVKVGDTITAQIYPLRDGRPGGLLFKVTTANGATYHAQ
jgi:hypothetical protein